MPPVTSAAPRASKFASRTVCIRSRLSSMKAPTKTMALNGTLMNRTQRQPGPSVEQSAEENADSAADPGDRRPDAEGGVAVTGRAEGAGQAGKRGGREHRCSNPLGEAGADE